MVGVAKEDVSSFALGMSKLGRDICVHSIRRMFVCDVSTTQVSGEFCWCAIGGSSIVIRPKEAVLATILQTYQIVVQSMLRAP